MSKSLYLKTETCFQTENCFVCGIPFAMEWNFRNMKKKDSGSFYCPAGCCLTYGEGSRVKEIRRLNEQLDKERLRVKNKTRLLNAERRSKAAVKGQMTKMKNRVSKGVCPCCNRHFKNLQRHMSNKHPDFEKSDE